MSKQDRRLALTVEYVKSRIHYSPNTGDFIWLWRTSGKQCSQWNAKYAGTLAGCIKRGKKQRYSSYRLIAIDNIRILAHQLAYFYMTGVWPDSGIDHKDGNGLNNKWDNLRLANQSQNNANGGARLHNKIGLKGVTYREHAKAFRATITVRGKSFHLGYFKTPEAAHCAYIKAAKRYFGDFARAK